MPIPHADKKQQADIGKRARLLQEKWTARRDLLAEAEARLGTLTRRKYKPEFLWPDLPSVNTLKASISKKLLESEKTTLALAQFEEELAKRLDALQGHLNSRDPLEANFSKGELRLTADGRPVLTRIYLDEGEGQLAEIYWRFLILNKPKLASAFAKQLAQLPSPPDSAAARQFGQRVENLITETKAIAKLEREMNAALYELYKLSPEERNLIEEDYKRQNLL